MQHFDVAIVGAGPAGAACAAYCARAGLRTVLVEKSAFPRHKVCGDCINPSAWEIFRDLEIAGAVLEEEHVPLTNAALEATSGKRVVIPLGGGPYGVIALKRETLDNLLLVRAGSLGAHLRIATPLRGVERVRNLWVLETGGEKIEAHFLIAADGRNSTVARLLKYGEITRPQRVALQTHIPLEDSLRQTVLLKLLPFGYCGAAPVNDRELNLCLVSSPGDINAAKDWAANAFSIDGAAEWHSITPLRRADRQPAAESQLFFIGDAARIVEPFTGEGTYYAMRSGKIAAEAVAALRGNHARADQVIANFRAQYTALYRDRLWVNRLARYAVTHHRAGDALISLGAAFPRLLTWLSSKVIRPPAEESPTVAKSQVA